MAPWNWPPNVTKQQSARDLRLLLDAADSGMDDEDWE